MRIRIVAGVIALVLVSAGCSQTGGTEPASVGTPDSAKSVTTETVSGVWQRPGTVVDGDWCVSSDGTESRTAWEGRKFPIVNAEQTVVGLGVFGASTTVEADGVAYCEAPFTVENVPADSNFYGLAVSTSAQYTWREAAEVFSGDLVITSQELYR